MTTKHKPKPDDNEEFDMEKKENLKPDDEEQSRRFVETAKQLEADETRQSFDDTFRIVASSTQRSVLPTPKDKA